MPLDHYCPFASLTNIVTHSQEFSHLVEMHRQAGALDEDQSKIMKKALDFKHSQVGECMTPIANLYSLDVSDVLDVKKMKEIFTSGYSRIPVHDKDRQRTVGMILAKDLILVDPKQNRTVGEVAEIFERTPLFFNTDTDMGTALRFFKQGRSHCAVVEAIDENDGQKKTVGFVTLEDILEELLDSDIKDETEDDVAQRLIVSDPSFREQNVESKVSKLGGVFDPEQSPNDLRKKPKETRILRKLTASNRLARVVADVTTVLGYKLQDVVKEPAFLASLELSISDVSSLPNITIHIGGDVSIGDMNEIHWYAPVRDAYQAAFTVSALPRSIQGAAVSSSGVSRRIIFNSEDALRNPSLANDRPHPVFKRGTLDPSTQDGKSLVTSSSFNGLMGYSNSSINSASNTPSHRGGAIESQGSSIRFTAPELIRAPSDSRTTRASSRILPVTYEPVPKVGRDSSGSESDDEFLEFLESGRSSINNNLGEERLTTILPRGDSPSSM